MTTAKNFGALTLHHSLALEACYRASTENITRDLLCMFYVYVLCYTETPPACVTVTSLELVSTAGEFRVC